MTLTREIKILSYIRRHTAVTGKQLTKKFPDIDEYYYHLKEKNICVEEAANVYSKEDRDKMKISDDEPIIYLTIFGDDVVLKHRREFWSFILPYGITTFIALVSAAPTIYKIVKFICNLFTQGTP